MELMERRNVIANQLHAMVAHGTLVTFNANVKGIVQVLGSGDITACGKNIFNLWGNGYWLSSTKKWYSSSSGAVCRPIHVSAGTVVTLSQKNASATYQFHEWNKWVENPADYTSNDNLRFITSGGKTYTVQNNCYLTVFANIGSDGFENREVQLEIGTVPTTYEAFSGTIIPAGTSLKSDLGINNIWSNAGDITVKYWTH